MEAARLRSVNFVATDAPYYPRYFTFVNPTCIEFGASPVLIGILPTWHAADVLSFARVGCGGAELSDHAVAYRTETLECTWRRRAGRAKDPTRGPVGLCALDASRDFFEGGCARLLDKALDALDMALLDVAETDCLRPGLRERHPAG